jgi:3-hydroxy-9,10-secoandrosta-1,3,5(10)-triene-9,17-dione monooxygenase reductase component
MLCSSVIVVSTLLRGNPVGFTCNSFSVLGHEPPLVSISVPGTTGSWPSEVLEQSFYINLLAADQADLAVDLHAVDHRFAPRSIPGSDPDLPVIDGVLAWLRCSLHATHRSTSDPTRAAQVGRSKSMT